MKRSLVVLLGGLIAGVLGAPRASIGGHVLHQKRDEEHRYHDWVKRDRLHPDTKVLVSMALTQRNVERGMDLVMSVSDPDSPSYGKYYTRDQIRELFAPSDESVSRVKRWLVESGVPESAIAVPRSKTWVRFDTTVAHLETLVKARYHVYDHVATRDEHVGTDEYHLPEGVAPHVDFVLPGVAFSRLGRGGGGMQKRKTERPGVGGRPLRPMPVTIQSNPGTLEDCSRAMTPDCIAKLYQIPNGTLSHPSNRLGIFEIAGEDYVQSSMDLFTKAFAPHIPAGTGPVVYSIDNSTGTSDDPWAAGTEAMLDFQVAVPIVYPQGTVLYVTPDSGADKAGVFNPFLDAIDGSYCNFTSHGYTGDTPSIDGVFPMHDCGTVAPTNVISISYGLTEPSYPARYLERQCEEWMKLSLAGVTLVVASGDDGVARPGGMCLGERWDMFVPDATCDCPYITAVGSTFLPPGKKAGVDAEHATSSFSSGGGFSNIYKTAPYQRDAVARYLREHNPGYKSYNTSRGQVPHSGHGVYNAQGRAYPDLACNGDNVVVVVGERQWLTGGTSESAPIVAAMFNRINEERIAAGKPVVGFVNPVLYKHPEMFNDILVGKQNKGGALGVGCSNDGFSCVEGWDPVTGMGTPNYPKMLEVFMSI
ncbi:Tripeptidyl-peptidase I [Purpureocillium takamizusanense]|uniref:Tripeptidyl-peptidase I n=1 Tax=Purpureocillium takamizusanense TaxID=2060973 RepID=A0A9Q8QLX0_9HYPO|nr:Tripeptidyl-peptidase I [Purpureocillium takamizusanense]UNI21181.1 Tripeptidyl-peptidase I [Purpureocillium takamizusanense]